MAGKGNKQLQKLLDEKQSVEAEGRVFNDEVFQRVKDALVKWGGPELGDYNPIVEMAKIANDPTVDDTLKARMNMEIASYMYPKVRSYEIKSKEDKTVNVNIKIAGYAQKRDEKVINPDDDISLEEGDDLDEGGSKVDYTDYVLKNTKKETMQ